MFGQSRRPLRLREERELQWGKADWGLLFSDELKSKNGVTEKVNVGLGMEKPRGRTGFSCLDPGAG